MSDKPETASEAGAGLRVVVQIPCHNEAETLPQVLAEIPRDLPGVRDVRVLVIDDGSSDGTAAIARAHGADHVLGWPHRRGLAAAFREGLAHCLRLGADVIVQTDGDNQYRGSSIPALVAPVMHGGSDICIGIRPIATMPFSRLKRLLQYFGSFVVRLASNTQVRDAASGFRAFSRRAALQLTVISDFSYTLETVLQAPSKGLAIAQVPIEVNPPTRPSRLAASSWQYVRRSAPTIFRMMLLYSPLRLFGLLGGLASLAGGLGIGRFMMYYLRDGGAGHIQSLVLASAALILGCGLISLGLVADLIAANRKHLEEVLARVRQLELGKPDGPDEN